MIFKHTFNISPTLTVKYALLLTKCTLRIVTVVGYVLLLE